MWQPMMLKIGDFGAAAILARRSPEGNSSPVTGASTTRPLQHDCTTFCYAAPEVTWPLQHDCTTFYYAAPEVLRGDDYSMSGDIWGIGVICWEMLQEDPRLPAVPISEDQNRQRRVAEVDKFTEKVATQASSDVPLLHLACWMLEKHLAADRLPPRPWFLQSSPH